ncbi:zinc finger CCCH domain-containing protein 66-like [Abrus precatorius]|uniref:Zinc finger CCCH domain-containing protein 66-like n=1 Tax=Abrus precatorius TaxID=3816 RepID=A0A8B8K1D9_ABRPR|nr:zinc finger CCCH domain-containing protein 66-like [Abrus precatorius]
MCSGYKRKPSQTGLIKGVEYGRQEGSHLKISALLEFSATDDVMAFKDAVEIEGCDVDEVGFWYGRRVGSKEVGFEERTPLMIAAMFGSKSVLSYILGTGHVDVNQACGSDGATALHCAVAGGSAASPEVIKLLLDASADVSTVDANGNRSCDLIVSVSNGVFNSRKRILQAILEGADGIDEAYLRFDDAVQQYVYTPRSSKDGTEKKDYPVDLSLPDIKNGIYSTDEFRMYTFKVKPCSRAYSHDWTECPFVHPGENARRRDPRKYQYSCVPCPEFRKGSCSKGDACEYAHGIFECWLHPAQYRTRLCKDEIGCTRRVCFFAHKLEELRPVYASTGSAMPSSSSYSASASSLDALTPPLTPSQASSPVSGTMWQTQSHVAAPTLQLSGSRLKTALNTRDADSDIELLAHENRQLMQQLKIEEMAAVSSLSSASKWKRPMPPCLCNQIRELHRFAGVRPTNFEDIFGSQIQSPTGIQVHQHVKQQLRDYPSNFSTSRVIRSPSFSVDPSGTTAKMTLNPRDAAFSNRSQSFIDHSNVNCNSEFPSLDTSVAFEPYGFSSWGSPDGKLDWAICDDELNKLRKSSSFGFHSSNSPLKLASTTVPPSVDEPDVSWVHSLVKDAAPMESEQYNCVEEQLQFHLNDGKNVVPDNQEQLYMEHEQIVA